LITFFDLSLVTKTMKTQFILLAALLLSAVSSAQETAGQITLQQCYEMSVKQSETIAITDESIAQAEAEYDQAKGSSLPDFFFGYDSTWQDRPISTGSTPGSLFISPQTNAKVGVRKSLFTGYRELAAIKSGASFVDVQKDAKNRALQLLLSDVASAFYATLTAETGVAISRKNHQLLLDRLKETKQRVQIGRNRSAEVAALESQVATLEAETLENERIAQTQRQLLSFFTGRAIHEQLIPKENEIGLKNVEEYLTKVGQRPDVQAQEKAIDVALGNVRLERSKHFPNLDAGANYYLDRQGYREDVEWDAFIGLEIPIWSWGATQGGVNAAKAQMNSQRLLARQVRRQAEVDVKNAYRDAVSTRQQKAIYEKASAAAEKEHGLTVRDYRSGLVSTFDVLETMDRLIAAERGLNLSTLRARLTDVNLKVAAGYTPEEILQ
jgi:outer membrane protein TolC